MSHPREAELWDLLHEVYGEHASVRVARSTGFRQGTRMGRWFPVRRITLRGPSR